MIWRCISSADVRGPSGAPPCQGDAGTLRSHTGPNSAEGRCQGHLLWTWVPRTEVSWTRCFFLLLFILSKLRDFRCIYALLRIWDLFSMTHYYFRRGHEIESTEHEELSVSSNGIMPMCDASWPSDTVERQRFGSSSVQVMTCYLMPQSPLRSEQNGCYCAHFLEWKGCDVIPISRIFILSVLLTTSQHWFR